MPMFLPLPAEMAFMLLVNLAKLKCNSGWNEEACAPLEGVFEPGLFDRSPKPTLASFTLLPGLEGHMHTITK